MQFPDYNKGQDKNEDIGDGVYDGCSDEDSGGVDAFSWEERVPDFRAGPASEDGDEENGGVEEELFADEK